MLRSRTLGLVLALGLLVACAPDGEAGGAASQPVATTGEAPTTPARAEGAATGTEPSAEASPTSADGAVGPATSDSDDATSATSGTPEITGATDTPAPGGPSVAAGTYRYDVEGSTSVGTFPPQPFTAVLTTVAHPVAQQGTQRVVTTTQFTEGSSPRSLDEERWLLHSTDDIRLARLVTDGNGDPIEFVLDPPAVLTPLAPTPGRSWEWTMTSTDGRTTARTVVQARGADPLTVGGTTVQTQVADATVTFTGEDFEGTQRMTIWFDPRTRLTVRQDASLEGRARVGGAWFDIAADDRRILRSLAPA